MGLHPIEQEILKRWKSFRRLFTFLEREYRLFNRKCFHGRLPQAHFDLKRMKFSWDPVGGAFVGAVYRPPQEERLARIEFSPLVLLDKQDLRIALAHEMVHHWEWVHPESGRSNFYSIEIRDLSRQRFPQPEREYDWRLAHSSKFLAKARDVAEVLQLPIEDFLFKESAGLLL